MKRVPVTLVLHLHEEVPDDWDEDSVQFFIEENHCNDNYVLALGREMDARPGVCHTCARSEAFVGHIPLAKIRELKGSSDG
jgi:hypothetical protein